MIIENFRRATGNEAGGRADEGRGKLTPALDWRADAPLAHVPHALLLSPTEHALVEHIVAYIQQAQPVFTQSLIVEYYIALKTHPFVLLAAADRQAGVELARLFAEAIVGMCSEQLALISGAAWHHATGEGGYFRSLHDRFSSLRCQTIAQEAAETCNLGKAYFVCFDSLGVHELAAHIAPLDLLERTCNIAVTAVFSPHELPTALGQFQQAAVIEVEASVAAQSTENLPAPVGFQRVWLRVVTNAAMARIERRTQQWHGGRLNWPHQLRLLHSEHVEAHANETSHDSFFPAA